jgi:hypothetical protein
VIRLHAIGAALVTLGVPEAGPRASAEQDPKPAADELSALKAQVTRLKGLVPDQSHAMADVGYHATNLRFAGREGNWPLAQFYSDEVRSHLLWAVRIIPERKDAEGREIGVGGILAGLKPAR